MELETQLLHLIDDSALSCDERVLVRCEYAKRLEEAGNYDAARDVLSDFWQRVGERPQTEGMDQRAAAELLLRVGVLLGWIGSTRQSQGAQEQAKSLISESMALYESLPDPEKAIEGRIELAVCHWREGAIDEARLMFKDALERLGETASELRAIALVRSAVVDQVAGRYSDALRILNEAASAMEKSSHTLRGKFHNELANVLKHLGTSEHREDYIDRALVEFTAASFHFEQGGHNRYRACVENNLGSLYLMVGRFTEAYEHLGHARRLLVNLKDRVHVAQVDETCARVLLAEGRHSEAERSARAALEVLENGGEHQLLAETLRTHGTALARLGRYPQARHTLQRALIMAEQASDREGAGQALLTVMEELGALFPGRDFVVLYERAADLLSTSQLPSISRRLNECARLMCRVVNPDLAPQPEREPAAEFIPATNWPGLSFRKEVRRYEAYLIGRALKDSRGVVTHAAQLLGFPHHESLNYLLRGRHKDLLPLRTPIETRRQSIIREAAREGRRLRRAPASVRPIIILHAEDDSLVGGMVRDTLEDCGWTVETCADGTAALRKMESNSRYDLLIFDYQLPDHTGLELMHRARQLPHRRQTPILMLSASDVEPEAWHAGADAFLRKPDDIGQLTATVARLLAKTAPGKQ